MPLARMRRGMDRRRPDCDGWCAVWSSHHHELLDGGVVFAVDDRRDLLREGGLLDGDGRNDAGVRRLDRLDLVSGPFVAAGIVPDPGSGAVQLGSRCCMRGAIELMALSIG